jgi:4-amino-4-deoxychorismate lyase
MKISINGQLVEDNQAVVSVYDHGFLYGIGLFETFRTYGGRPFLLDRHLKRLQQGCEELGIPFRPDLPQTERTIAALLRENGLADAYFRLSVSAGTEILGLPAGDYAAPTVILYVKELPPRNETVYRQGKALQLLKLRRNTPEGAVRFKSFHYMNNILAKRELQSYPWAGQAEGLFLTGMGCLAEGIVSNLFFVKNGKLHTPGLETGILPGITRDFVIELASRSGLPAVQQGCFTWEQLQDADESFITNSIQEIVPITTLFDVDGSRITVASGEPGPCTKQLMALYQNETGSA